MNTHARKALAGVAGLGAVAAFAAPVSAASGAQQISGTGSFAAGEVCDDGPPAGFESFVDLPPVVLTGSLEGCLFTDVEWSEDLGAPSGVYRERGSEVFVGTLDGGTEGTFTTHYRFTGKFDPDTGSQVKGRCQHPLVTGSGTGGFEGATGRLDFKDDVDAGIVSYRGHLKLG